MSRAAISQAGRLSAGVVVVRAVPEGWRYLLLRAFRHWDFPKGMVERSEAPLAAAIREAREETGLDDLIFPWGEAYAETTPYSRGKVARYYLGRTATSAIVLPVNAMLGRPEHHEYRWLDREGVAARVVPRLHPVLDWANAFLDGSPG